MAIHVVKAFTEGIAELRAHGVIASIDDSEDETETEDDTDEA
jgi:hypothetical protein